MKRIEEKILSDQSVAQANEYVQQKFSKGGDVEKTLVANCIAHGFYGGARKCEEKSNSWAAKLFQSKGLLSQESLAKISIEASNNYVIKKSYSKNTFSEIALIKSTYGLAFQKGFLWREFQEGVKG